MQEKILKLYSDRDRSSSDDILLAQLNFIGNRGVAGSRGRGWAFEVQDIERDFRGIDETPRWRYSGTIRFYRRTDTDPARAERQAVEILEWASTAGHNSKFGSRPWITVKSSLAKPSAAKPSTSDGKDNSATSAQKDSSSRDLTDDYVFDNLSHTLSQAGTIKKGEFYKHLYGLDAQISVLLSALQAAGDSGMENRFHTLLWGDPGCGKTEILEATARLLQSIGVNHLLLDATSTTEAGMRKSLLDQDAEIPSVILIEEIEKVVEASMRWLLGIMDVRGRISQANFRKTASRRVPAIVIATANDMQQLGKMMYGALRSRFQHEVYCPRPSREVLRMILEREVGKLSKGDPRWIDPALKYCYDERKITDPRKIIPVCLCGKDKLFDGTYQKALEATMFKSSEEEKENR